ncbi:hypothetical protein [Nostoc sp. C110]|uniref:hypothetical protein n=1 Tax=Nostoc sp. C110 TaxID=3349876 RepID=UPI00370D8A69
MEMKLTKLSQEDYFNTINSAFTKLSQTNHIEDEYILHYCKIAFRNKVDWKTNLDYLNYEEKVVFQYLIDVGLVEKPEKSKQAKQQELVNGLLKFTFIISIFGLGFAIPLIANLVKESEAISDYKNKISNLELQIDNYKKDIQDLTSENQELQKIAKPEVIQELEQKLDNVEKARQNINEELAKEKSRKCLIRFP